MYLGNYLGLGKEKILRGDEDGSKVNIKTA
jgi:hypothetical protein